MVKRAKTAKGNGPWRRVLRFAGWLGLACVIASLVLVLPFRWLDPRTTAFMITAQARGTAVHRQWVPLSSISPSMQLAVLASEDQRFPDHFGLDPGAIENAIRDYRHGGGLRGASTITQQTAKNLYLWSGRSFVRKGLEAWFAVLLEACWGKQRILEVYLNVAEFGRGIYGVEQASMTFFGKHAADLGAPEAALLAAVLPDPRELHPNQPSDYLRERQRWIIRQMRRLGGTAYLERLR